MTLTTTFAILAALLGGGVTAKVILKAYLQKVDADSRDAEPWVSLVVWQTDFYFINEPEHKYVVTAEALTRNGERRVLLIHPPQIPEERIKRDWRPYQHLLLWRQGGSLPPEPKAKAQKPENPDG
jgi:hypothetical protein